MAEQSGKKHRDETERERADRNLGELLQELRVALPGVQVLFAFLLTLPFAQGFADVTEFQRAMYFATLILTALASVALIAPSMTHRLQFRLDRKEEVVMTGHFLTIVGMMLLGCAIVCAVILISDFVFGTAAAIAASATVALTIALLWWAIPLRGAAQAREDED